MQNQNSNPQAKPPIRRGRKFLIGLGRIVAVLLLLLLVGTVYESAAEAADIKAYPPPGQMVDMGGYHLHLHCTGSGSPTVVLESGLGDDSSIWGWVQPEVAKTTRVCSYDRAGLGWSEASPQPRTAREFATELHTLLGKAHEPGPYVLAAHSLGGYTARVYAHDYPAEISGLVLVDVQDVPTAENANPSPAPKPGSNSLPALLARVGLARLLGGALGANQDLPQQDKQPYAAFSVTPQYAQTFMDEVLGMPEGGAQARAVTSLGALPLTILSRGKDQDAQHTAAQTALLQLSTNSQQIFAEKSGHRIMIEQPEVVNTAIVKMVERLRK